MMSQTDIFYFFSKDLCIYTSMLKLIIQCQIIIEFNESYRGGTSRTKSFLWAKPKASVFKNWQFRDPLCFLRKIVFFWKKQKLVLLLNDNLFLFFFKYFFHFFRIFFFYGHFFSFLDTFFGGGFFWKKNLFCPKIKTCFFQKQSSKKRVFEKQNKVTSFTGTKRFYFFQKKTIFLKTKKGVSGFENGCFWLCPHIILSKRTPPPPL